jgi:DNA-binding beta-propeller fold protein YncE
MIADVPTGSWIVWLGALVSVACGLPYARQAYRGAIYPSWVSWSVWTATTGYATATSLAAGAPLAAIVPGAAFVRCASILVCVMVGGRRARDRGVPRDATTRLDRGCIAACVLIAILLLVTRNPVVGLVAAIATDFVAGIPTYRNAWDREETPLNFAGATFSAWCVVMVLQGRTFATWAAPLYELAQNLVLTVLVLTRGSPRVQYRRARGLAVARGWTPPRSRRFIGAVVGSAAAVLTAAAVLAAGVVPVPAPRADAPGAAVAPVVARAANQAVQLVAPSGPVGPAPAVAPSAALPAFRGAPLPVGAGPGFAALVPSGRQLWITHGGSRTLTVLDVASGRTVGTVRLAAGPPRFITFCPDGAVAYVSVYTDDAPDAPHVLVAVDVASVQQVAEIPVGRRPWASACSADGTRVVVPSHDDGRLDVIDTRRLAEGAGAVERQVPVAANPHWVAVGPDGRWWTANHESNAVTLLSADLTAQQVIPLHLDGAKDCQAPHSVAVSPDGSRIAVACFASAQLYLLDGRDGHPTGAVEVGRGPQAVAWTADGARVWSADVYAGVSVVDPATGVRTASLSADDARSPTSIALTRDGSSGYATNLDSGTVSVFDPAVPTER